MKSAGFLNEYLSSDDKSPIRKRIGFSFIFAIRSAQIGENGIEMDKNDRKFNLPGGLTAGGFSLPATIIRPESGNWASAYVKPCMQGIAKASRD